MLSISKFISLIFHRNLLIICIGFACLAFVETKAANASTCSFQSYAGRWVGHGRITFTDGNQEKILCRVTYFSKNGGKNLAQNIRCASTSMKFEIKSKFECRTGKISGSWKETIHNLAGSLTGKASNAGFNLNIRAQSVAAKMSVKKNGSRQTVRVNSNGQTVRQVLMSLKKG